MKNKISKNVISKLTKLFLALFMCFSSLNLTGISTVQALTLNYQADSSLEKSFTINGIWGSSSPYSYTIKLGGEYGFCLDMGKVFYGNKHFDRNPWSGVKESQTVKRILNWFYNGDQTEYDYWLAQVAIWGIQEGKIKDPLSDFRTIWVELDKVYDAMYGRPAPGDMVGPDCRDIMQTSPNGEFYVYSYTSGYQRVATNVKGYRPTYSRDKVTATKTYSVNDKVDFNLRKVDDTTNHGLSGVNFDLYKDDRKVTSLTTNNDGYASHTFNTTHSNTATASATYCNNYNQLSPKNQAIIGNVDFTSRAAAQAHVDKEALNKAKAEVQKLLNEKHTYKAVETKTKEAYYLDPSTTTQIQSFASNDGSGTVSMSFTNKRQLGTINITKLDNETKNPVDTASYGLYAKTNIVHPDGHTGIVYHANDLVATFPQTNASGQAALNNLYLGEYYVKEITAPYGYQINPKQYDVTLSYAGQSVTVTDSSTTVDNTVQRAEVSMTKKDQELSNGKDQTIFDNDNNGSQGDATRVGATYGLYARQDIVHPDGHIGTVQYNATKGSINEIKLLKGTDLVVKDVKASAGQLLATAKTDINGNIAFTHLYNGQYFIKEIEPSEGYLLDPTEYELDVRYTNQAQAVVSKHTDVFETVKKQAFEVLKVGHVPNYSGVTNPLANVEFTVKLESDVQRLGWDNAPAYDVLKTDKKGYAKSIELPYGYYRVKETKANTDYDTAEDFFVTINEDNRKPQEFSNKIIINEQFTALVKAVKKDLETGKIVALANTTFKIKALSDVFVDGKKFEAGSYIGYWNWNIFDGFYTDTWKTNKEGYVLINEKLSAGEYQLEEIHAPYGYILDTTPVKFKITNQGMVETSPQDHKTPIITVQKSDVSVKGQITVEKRGEVLIDYRDGQFIYEERPLANAVFEIKAKENILDPSNDGTILYGKGTVVETLTTQSNGKATSSKLPLGKYEVIEKTAPHGMTINPESKTVTLKYANETTPIVFENTSLTNKRQKVELALLKRALGDVIPLSLHYELKPLAGAEFDLIANQDITNVDGEVIVTKETVLAHHISNEKGKFNVDLDLPLDVAFKFIETKAPEGYILDTRPIEFTTTYDGQDTEKLVIKKIAINKPTEIKVSKIDITTSKELPGNTLTIFEKDQPGNTFETWVSGNEPHVIKNLSTNVRYVLRETSAVKGFFLANDIEFELDTNGNLFIINEEGQLVEAHSNKIVMKNDLIAGKLEWNKTGEIFNQTITGQTEYGKTEEPVWNKSNLLQSEITIYAAEDIVLGNNITYYKKDQKIQTLESDFDPVSSMYLLVGKYYYVETKTPHGYITDTNKHFFEIKDNQSIDPQIVKEELFNYRPSVKVNFKKVMEDYQYSQNKDAYKDVLFGIYAREDIYDYKGNVAIKNGTLIATSGIDNQGHLVHMPDLPNGVYYLKELQTNKDYVLNPKEYDFEIGYHGPDVATYTITIGDNGTVNNELARGSIQIHKVDQLDDTKILKNVEFNLSKNPTMSDILLTASTNDKGIASFENLELGTYYIQEAHQLDGYALNEHIYKVDITKDGELLEIKCINKPTEMLFSKLDATTKSELPGATITIIDKETNQMIDEWVSTNEPHKINYLIEGKEYIMIEKYAPKGYLKAKDIKFTAKDGEHIIMEDEHIPENPSTGDHTNLLGISAVALLSLIASIYMIEKRKEEQDV